MSYVLVTNDGKYKNTIFDLQQYTENGFIYNIYDLHSTYF